MGRTALAWAVARNDSHAVVTLLKYGADPNIIDVQYLVLYPMQQRRVILHVLNFFLMLGLIPPRLYQAVSEKVVR